MAKGEEAEETAAVDCFALKDSVSLKTGRANKGFTEVEALLLLFPMLLLPPLTLLPFLLSAILAKAAAKWTSAASYLGFSNQTSDSERPRNRSACF